ncbi:MAG: ABC transporter permease [Verrucomicrobiaceae bacterium]|nr:MAG: ABC transporter permease [Verrucomicrobiaceae bacterium]
MIQRLASSEFFVLGLCALLLAGLGPFTPGLLSAENLVNVLAAMLPLLLVAAGQTVVLIGGGIDLSATAIIALASVAGSKIMTLSGGWMAAHPAAVPVAVGAMLLAGFLTGLTNGIAIAWLRMSAFIVTLTSLMGVSGLTVWFTDSKNIAELPAGFLSLGQRLPPALGIAAGALALTHLMLTRSIYGRWIHAVGHNAATARVSGVPVPLITALSYAVSGLSAGAAAILLTGRLETGSPVLGQTLMLDIIGAAVIGGTSLFGGRGNVLWTVSGVLFLTLLDNALNLRGLSHFVIMMIKGAVILLAAGLDVVRRGGREE